MKKRNQLTIVDLIQLQPYQLLAQAQLQPQAQFLSFAQNQAQTQSHPQPTPSPVTHAIPVLETSLNTSNPASTNPLSSSQNQSSALFNIEKIVFSEATTTKIPKELTYFPNLRELSISKNFISKIPATISSLANLTKLNLSHNNLALVSSEIKALKSLKKLDLSFNRIVELPNVFESLESLSSLDISKNQITALPLSLGRLNLKFFGYTGNPLVSPPLQICEKDSKFRNVSSYLERSREINSDPGLVQWEGIIEKEFVVKSIKKRFRKIFQNFLEGNANWNFRLVYSLHQRQNTRPYQEDRWCCLSEVDRDSILNESNVLPNVPTVWTKRAVVLPIETTENNEPTSIPTSTPTASTTPATSIPQTSTSAPTTSTPTPTPTPTLTTTSQSSSIISPISSPQVEREPRNSKAKVNSTPVEPQSPPETHNNSEEDSPAEGQHKELKDLKELDNVDKPSKSNPDIMQTSHRRKKQLDKTPAVGRKKKKVDSDPLASKADGSPKDERKFGRRIKSKDKNVFITEAELSEDDKTKRRETPDNITLKTDPKSEKAEVKEKVEVKGDTKSTVNATSAVNTGNTGSAVTTGNTVTTVTTDPVKEVISSPPIEKASSSPATSEKEPKKDEVKVNKKLDKYEKRMLLLEQQQKASLDSRSFIPNKRCKSGQNFMGLFGVYDGHGGDSVSTYVKENLHVNFLNQKKLISSGNIQEALKKGFVETDKQLYELCKEHNDRSGSTAVFAVLESNKIWVAWTGDTRAVLCSGYKAVELTNDHTPHNFNEKGRVIQAGGWISNNGCSRVNGLLAVTRALGDFYLKEPVEYVTAVPEITEREISPFDQFIIIASDGFWDVFGSQEAVDKIVTCKNPYTIAEEVVLNAIDRGSRDNITVLLIWFDWKMDLAPLVSQFEATSKKKDKGSSEDTEERGRVVMSDRSERNSRSASPPTVGIFQRERTEKGTSSKKKKTLAKSTLMEKRKLSNSNLGSVKKSEEK